MLYGPLEAGIGRNVSGRHCRRSSMLHNIGGARIRLFFKLAGVLFVAFSEAFSEVKHASK